MECSYGCDLCIGPPVENGFYYDAYMGSEFLEETECKNLEKKCEHIIKQNQTFERIVLTKEEALEMFQV
jgi:threonyl-tRNA synthetase